MTSIELLNKEFRGSMVSIGEFFGEYLYASIDPGIYNKGDIIVSIKQLNGWIRVLTLLPTVTINKWKQDN
jgi:hypothetical protein